MAKSDEVVSRTFISLPLHIFLLLTPLLSEASSILSLPGFQGSLPFQLETGYVGVGETEDVQLFYYFVKSERNPQKDPLLLWLTGGPGCSAWSGLVFEIGPLNFNVEQYNGSLPTLIINSHSWTKVSNIIFLDLPVGTGFSYARTSQASKSSDLKQMHHALQFLRKWLIQHPEFISNPFYVAGDSYSGITVPVLGQLISEGNEEGIKPLINLQGYLLGNPVTHNSETNFKIPYAHGMGLISDELYQSLQENCGGEYQDVDPSNTVCLNDVKAYDDCVSGLNPAHILEPLCAFASPKPQKTVGIERKSRSLSENIQVLHFSESEVPALTCRSYGYLLCGYWANDPNVRKVLGIQAGSIGEWKRCNYFLPYEKDVDSSVGYHAILSAKGYRSLIYSGDHDMGVPFLATQAWIRSLNYSIVDDWRPWVVHGQVGGYTRTYSNRMTFATIKGAGHTAPEYKRKESLAMLQRWLDSEPL
ncbi:hypothetical protein FEM48_Zijuj06G0044700 [Ziziphus jujuba var. spinosa]|uniref:Serine carboxypeptidase-like 7 n=1 Tax=Ziziphus jujuba var. spinosa TaxID=714518 RepID=A0A978V761_ZIZJJ|nr:hypothetical protein FEM48_Zijuj06G0044700 [Ziziphus jujuba var. spinosa]